MAIGERIRFLRNLRGMTQKYLGVAIGFPEKTADIRMAQYESGTRTPKADVTNELAKVLEVSPQALTVPDIDSYNGLMHTLFAMEDLYGLRIDTLSDEVCIRLDKGMGTNYITMFEMFSAWQRKPINAEMVKSQKRITTIGDIPIRRLKRIVLKQHLTSFIKKQRNRITTKRPCRCCHQ